MVVRELPPEMRVVARPPCPHEAARAMAGDGCCVVCGWRAEQLVDAWGARAEQMQEVNTGDEDLHSPDRPRLTAAEVAERARRASAQLDKRSLARFVRSGWHVLCGAEPLEWNWHHEALCASLQGLFTEWMKKKRDPKYIMLTQRCVFNLCPISLKTKILVFFCAWAWLHWPSWKVGYVSANPEVLSTASTECRQLVTSKWYRERFRVKWEMRPDLDRVYHWATTAGGARISRGIDSKVTGMHVDCVLCDDPDDAHDVHSEAERRKVKGKWRALGNRLNDQRCDLLILVQQRVHPDDLSATCLQQGYTHACWPLEYSAKHRVDVPWFKDPRTVDGEIMHPVRHTPEVLQAERSRLGTAGFQAQYNQRPEAFEGALFRRVWIRFFRLGKRDGEEIKAWVRPDGCSEIATRVIDYKRAGAEATTNTPDWDRTVMSVDASFGSLSESASRVSISVYGMKGADRFLLHNTAKRRTLGETERTIGELYEAYPYITKVLVEKKANGAAVIERMQSVISGMIPIEPEGGKEARGAAAQPSIEAGNLYVLEGAPWLTQGEEPDDSGWLDEICSFPHGRKDDRVDDLTQFLNHYAESNRGAWRKVNWSA